MSRYPLDQRLQAAGEAVRAVEKERRTVAVTLRIVVKAALDADWPKTRIAQTAGISRQTVYDILNEEPR